MTLESGCSEVTQEGLLEHLRKRTDKIKSYDEIVNLLHVIASEQKARSMLRSCMDKVLINMSDIQSLRDMLERLRSVARTNGLRFQLLLDSNSTCAETICQIIGDIFKVEITLDGQDTHFCLDVKVHHSENARSCPELTQIIRDGKFLELSKYLKNLIEMYPVNMDRQTKTKVYLALQSLEVDLTRMCQIYKESHQDCDALHMVMNGAVGLIAPHVVDKSFRFNFFLSPYDLIDPVSKQMMSDLHLNFPEGKGLLAEIKVVSQDVLRTLPISPLISNNHPINGTGQPRFAEVNQHNSVALGACFVLKLHPPFPLTAHVAAEIEKEIGIPVFDPNVRFDSYLSLILDQGSCSEVVFDDLAHRYHLDFKHLNASMVEQILFTHPGQVASIVDFLRKQAYFNTLLLSCIRKTKRSIDEDRKEWYFDISSDAELTKFNITFEHPLCATSTAFAEILFSNKGFLACHLFTGRGDPPLCSDQYVTKILQKSFSLPITMRNLKKQTKQQPRKDPDRSRHPLPRQLTLHPAAMATHKKPAPPPVPKQMSLPVVPTPATMATGFLPPPKALVSEPENTETDILKSDGKETQHPMLTQLLKPSNDQSVAPKTNTSDAQSKKHPMLLTLLNESDPKVAPPLSTSSGAPSQAQAPSLQQTSELAQQFSQTNPTSMQSYFNTQPQQQHFTGQMPPPPSYPGSVPVKQNPQQPAYQQQQMQQYQSQPSPLDLDDLALTPSMTSQYSLTQTPPLVPMHNVPPSPNPPSLPSPMYQLPPSPMHPPMNTPQPLPITSPMHSVMTPPPPQQSPRKAARRPSRQKSHSTEVPPGGVQGQESKAELTEFGFSPQFGEAPSPMSAFFGGMSPGQGGGFMGQQHKLVSPSITSSFHTPVTSTFSFDSDFGLDSDLTRKNSLLRRNSSQGGSFQQVLNPNAQQQGTMHFGQDQPQSGFEGSQMDLGQGQFHNNNQFQNQQQMQQQQQMVKQHQGHFTTNVKDIFSTLGGSLDSQPGGAGELTRSNSIHTPNSVVRSLSSSDPTDLDPFTFDDNRTPSKISMPDSASAGNTQRSKSLTRQPSSSTVEDSTLKGLLVTSPGLVSALTSNSSGKPINKMDKPNNASLHSLLSKNASATSQRRTSDESGSSLPSSNLISGHKPLIRQNAIGKGAPQIKLSSLPGKGSDGKDKARKRAAGKDDANKGPPKRRGRPPSTEKRESVKRRKIDSSLEDGDGPGRGKIVLNVQLNKGMPISSTTKTKPNAPETAANNSGAAPEKPAVSASAPTAAPSSTNAPTAGIENYPAAMQMYFKTQVEMEKKKKERKLGGGSASPVTPGSVKGNGKFPATQSAKSNGGKALSTVPKTQVSPQGKGMAAPRPRKGSINDVVDKLRAGHAPNAEGQPKSQAAAAGQGSRNVSAGSGVAKFTDKAPSDYPGPPKLKPIAVQVSKIGQNLQSPKLGGGKSPTDERGLGKPTSILKQGSSNKSPSHSAKPNNNLGRVPQQAKKDKPRPVTPQRDRGFVTPPLTKTSPKTQIPSSLPRENQEKLKSTLKGINEAAAATTKHSGAPGDTAKQRMGAHSRPPGGKSPGRSVTPPQSKMSFPSGNPEVQIRNDSAIQNLLKNKKALVHPSAPTDPAKPPAFESPGDSEAAEKPPPMIRPPSANSQGRKIPSSENQLSQAARKRPALTQGQPTGMPDSPMSPDDQLVIDDETVGSKVARSVTPVQASLVNRVPSPLVTSSTKPQVLSEELHPAPPSIGSIMKKASSDFENPPSGTTSPCLIDDALMDVAVTD